MPRACGVTLVCHPRTPSGAIRAIEARVTRAGDGMISLDYAAAGMVDRVRIPAVQAPHRGDRLWQHTCFEVFIRVKDERAYHELNFAPSGAWAAFAFEDYRQGTALVDEALDPRIVARSDAERLTLEATARLDRLSPRLLAAPLSIGLCAVIEDRDGALSYWAIEHPPGKPDFHHPKAFALELDEPRD